MNEIQITARCTIHDGKHDAFEAAAQRCVRSVVERDEGTQQYDWFYNADRSVCVVRETYRDSAAVLEHMGNLGDALGALLETCDLELELFGDPSPELVEASAGLDVTVYSYFQGMRDA